MVWYAASDIDSSDPDRFKRFAFVVGFSYHDQIRDRACPEFVSSSPPVNEMLVLSLELLYFSFSPKK
jgi:hypothetical protein